MAPKVNAPSAPNLTQFQPVDVKTYVKPGAFYVTRSVDGYPRSPDTADSIAFELAKQTGVSQETAKRLLIDLNQEAFYAFNDATVAPKAVLKMPSAKELRDAEAKAAHSGPSYSEVESPAPKPAVEITTPRTPNRAVNGVVTVVGGDSVNQILRDNGFQLRDANGKDLTPELHAKLKELNPGLDVDRIKPSQKIVLPGQGGAPAGAGGSSAPAATAQQIQELETQIQMAEQLVGALPAGPGRTAAETELQQMKLALEQLKAGKLPTQEAVDRELAEANGRVAFQYALDTMERAEKIAALEGQITIEKANLKYSNDQADISYRVGNRFAQEQHQKSAAATEQKLSELNRQLEQLKTGN